MEYRSTKTLSIVVICSIGGYLVIQLVLATAGMVQALGPDVPLRGSGTSVPILIEQLLGSVTPMLYLATGVVFLVWVHHAHRNLEVLQPSVLEFTPGWAVGWWFVPIFSLFRPFQVMREIWSESDPELEPDVLRFSADLHSAPGYMTLWWAAWIIMLFASWAVAIMLADTSMSLNTFGSLIAFKGIVTIPAGMLAIWLVRDITGRQESRHGRLGTNLPQSAPPPPPVFEDIEKP